MFDKMPHAHWHCTRIDAGDALESVNVLRVAPQQPPAVGQHLDHVVRGRRRVLARKQLFREHVERLWVGAKELNVEHGLGRRQVVLGELAVETGARALRVMKTR